MLRKPAAVLATASIIAMSILGACEKPGAVGSAHEVTAVDGAASTYNVENWPAIGAPAWRDEQIEAQVEALLAAMTLEQKVGQIIQADNTAVTPEEVRKYHLGSVLSGGNSAPGGKAYANAAEWLAMADAYYEASMTQEGVETSIPILLGIDAVHGHNNVIGGTIFPHNIGLGAARDPDLVRRIAEVTALELRVTGHDWTFAPTVAVPQDDRWGRAYEGFSEDPDIVASYAGEIVNGLQGVTGADDFMGPEKVISTAKHYVADGGTENGKDQGDAKASEAEIARLHGAGYPPAIRTGALSVMASFSSWNGEALHGHKYLLTDVLKDRMGFQGFVVGDWNGHAKVAGCTNESCPSAVNGGLDMFMAPDSWKGLYKNTLAQAKSGEISAARLDDAVRRILRAKLVYGLFEQGRPSSRPFAGDETILGAPAHRAIAREAVRKSIVLLKNNDNLLPLERRLNVLVAGAGADSISKQSGGWTLTWQGGGLDNSLFPNGQSIYQGVKQAVEEGGGAVQWSENGAYTNKPDVAIVVFGENPYAEFQGDLENVAFRDPDGSSLEIMKKLQADGVKVISVFISGRPLWVNREINASDAFVAAWLPGSEAGGIADVLFRENDGAVKFDFRGKLSFSWPRTAVQTPLNAGEEGYDPLFPLGFGLTYDEDGSLGVLSEDSGLSDEENAEPGVYFASGSLAPGLVLKTGADITSLDEGAENAGMAIRKVDHQAQEDAIELTFPSDGGAAALSGASLIDLSRETVGQLELSFAFRADEVNESGLKVGMFCNDHHGACAGVVDLASVMKSVEGEGWRHMRISLSCLADAGADMEAVSAPFVIASSGGGKIALADIRLAQDSNGAKDCGLIEE